MTSLPRPIAPEALETVPTSELLNELKRRHTLLSKANAYTALIGPPCVGKRTQAEALRRTYGICRISGEDLLAAGKSDDAAISKLMELLERPVCRRGYVLEGFPQTAMQAKRLEEVLAKNDRPPLQEAIFMDAPDELLMERCKGKIVHEASGRIYHEQFKPPADGVKDDFTGEPLTQVPFAEAKFGDSCSKFRENVDLLKQYFSKTKVRTHIVDASAGGDVISGAIGESLNRPASE
mmetsp:Transcript_41200/g.62243  ORF Transcript_41200/g.62243 Transcript_41200/m.62243 type:complete len:236 (-) Transcript_41200:80-787(-)